MTAEQRLEYLYQFLNHTSKSGIVNVRPVIQEIAKLLNLDPDKVLLEQ